MDTKRLQKWRERKKELGVTLDDLAKATKISKRTLTGIFSGKDEKYQNPTIATIEAIEQALEFDKTGTKETASVELTPQEDRMLQAFRGLNDATRELVIMLLLSIQK